MFVFKIAQFFNPLNEIEAIDNAWVDDKNWFPKVNQKYLWISISKVEIRYEIQHDLVYFEKPCKTSPFLMTPECKLKVLCINNIYTHTSTTLRCEW